MVNEYEQQAAQFHFIPATSEWPQVQRVVQHISVMQSENQARAFKCLAV